jgi:predicted aconitase
VAGSRVVAIMGLPSGISEDRLKAIGAAAASSGSVGMFHAVGSTPEAPDLESALGGREPGRTITIGPDQLRQARDDLTTAAGDHIGAVSLGAPHYSVAEFERLVELLGEQRTHPDISVYVNTGRDVLAEIAERGWPDLLAAAGVQIVTDTCTYITPIMNPGVGTVMTDSAKWAYYAPGNIGVDVIFGSVEDCVASAVAGRALRDEAGWSDG